MKMHTKTIPYGSLPYDEVLSASKMMVKLYEKMPYVPYLPHVGDYDILQRTLLNLPAIGYENGNFMLQHDYERLRSAMNTFEEIYFNPIEFDNYLTSPAIWKDYLHIVKKSNPKQTVINLIGPMTVATILTRDSYPSLLLDKFGRKFLVQIICIKALGYIKQIYNANPKTEVLVILEDDKFAEVGNFKREYNSISNESITDIYYNIISKMHDYDARVCIQCFNKCDWQIPIDAGADMISFDAYKNPNNLSIIPDKINEFLTLGGYINWGIIPVKSDEYLKTLSLERLYNLFKKSTEGLINSGVNPKLLYNNSTVSIQGDMSDLSVMFAEKAIMLSIQLGKRIPEIKN